MYIRKKKHTRAGHQLQELLACESRGCKQPSIAHDQKKPTTANSECTQKKGKGAQQNKLDHCDKIYCIPNPCTNANNPIFEFFFTNVLNT